jgi:hypothetical protein
MEISLDHYTEKSCDNFLEELAFFGWVREEEIRRQEKRRAGKKAR